MPNLASEEGVYEEAEHAEPGGGQRPALRRLVEMGFAEPESQAMLELAGGELYRMQLADRLNEPVLTQWSAWGERIDQIEVSPLWKRAEQIAAERGIVARLGRVAERVEEGVCHFHPARQLRRRRARTAFHFHWHDCTATAAAGLGCSGGDGVAPPHERSHGGEGGEARRRVDGGVVACTRQAVGEELTRVPLEQCGGRQQR